MSYWIFKCDPRNYRLADRICDPNPTITWWVTKYKKEIGPGDTVFLMETGANRFIRAVMRVDSVPQEMAERESEQAYWNGRDTGTRSRVVGTITHRADIAVDELSLVEGLQKLSIFHGVQQGTNFRVSDEEGAILISLVQSQFEVDP